MSGIENATSLSLALLTNASTLASFTENIHNIVPPSPYSLDIVIVLSVITGLVIFLTVVGNLLVIVAFFTTPKLRTYNNYFIFGLAVADLLVGAVDMPLFAIVIILGRWPFGEIFCDIFTFFDYAFTHISLLLVTLISLDRCVAVSDPFRHRLHWRRRSRAIFIIAISYIIPVIIWLPPTTLWQIIQGNDHRPFPEDVCKPLYFESVVAGFVLPVVYFFIPFTVTTILCVRIYVVIRNFYKGRRNLRLASGNMQSTTRADSSDIRNGDSMTSVSVSTMADRTDVGEEFDLKSRVEEIKTASSNEVNPRGTKRKEPGTESLKGVRTLAFIVAAMWIAWFPSVIVAVTSQFCSSCVPAVIYSAVIFWGYMNSLINPVCYALADEAFKNGFIRILTLGYCQMGERNLPKITYSQNK